MLSHKSVAGGPDCGYNPWESNLETHTSQERQIYSSLFDSGYTLRIQLQDRIQVEKK